MSFLIRTMLLLMLCTTCFASCYYQDFFSEEHGVTGPFSPMENYGILGMQCSGSLCDNLKFRVCDNYKLQGQNSQTSTYFSEEQGVYLCPKGRVLAGIKCDGYYCDNKWYFCQYPSNFRRGDAYYWTGWFSEEEGDMACNTGYVVAGVDCDGYYCDNMRLACYQVLDEVSVSSDAFGCNYEGKLAYTLNNVLETTTYTKNNAQNQCNVNQYCNGVQCNSGNTKCYLMNGNIKDSSDTSQTFYWKFCEGSCTWTDWFSEEDGMPPPDDNVSNDKRNGITGLRCRGYYCDDISVQVCDNLELSGDYEETSDISEENPTKFCFQDKPVVSSIVCWGYYCDNKVLRCREPSNFALGDNIYYTPAISEEYAALQQCPPNYVLVGMSCDGYYCDNIILVCQEYYMVYPCEIGEGSLCLDCTEPAARKVANHCSACNPGFYLDTTGLCVLAWYAESASFWEKYGSGNTVVTISESSTFTRTDTVAVSVEDSMNFHYGFGNGYAYSLCVGYSIGLIKREHKELCLMLNYYFEYGWDVGRAVSHSVENSLSYSETKTCTVALNENCASGGGCQLYRWVSMREEQPTLVTTFLETCDFFQKWGDSKSYPPNCVPGYCSDYDLQGEKSNDCVACDVMDAFLEPIQFCQYGFLKASGACCNIGCGNCEEDQCASKLGGNGANQCCPSKFTSACQTFGETGCIVAGMDVDTSTASPPQDILDYGATDCGEGWFDVQYQGVANDYCRWVGSCGCRGECSWWSCALAGSNMQYTALGEFNEGQFQGPYEMSAEVPVTSAPYELNVEASLVGRRNLQPQPFPPANISNLFPWEHLDAQKLAITNILNGCGVDLDDYASSVIWMPYPHINSTLGTVTLSAIIVPSSDNSHAFQANLAAHAPTCDEELSHFLGVDTVIEYSDYKAPARKPMSSEDPHYPIEEEDYDLSDSDDGLSTGAIVGIVAAVVVSAAVIFFIVKYYILSSSTKDESLLTGENYAQMTLN